MTRFAGREDAADFSPGTDGPASGPERSSCFYCGAEIFFTPAGFWSVTGEDTYSPRMDIRCEEAPEGRHTPDYPSDPEDELDQLATTLACAILLAAFAEFGLTRRAFGMAAEAVLASDAFARPADGSLLSRPEV